MSASAAVYVAGKKVALDPARLLGSGGEADVFDVGGGRALKVWKTPAHPDLVGLPHEQQAARERIAQHQRKLREFPTSLPARVIAPLELATDKRGATIVGYTMRLVSGCDPLLRLADRRFREGRVPHAAVVAVLRDLHLTLSALHARGVVVGDLNDLNVLCAGPAAWVIDADSMQFGPYACGTFTERFVDPLRCDPHAPGGGLTLIRPHGRDSDWYAFAVMLMQSLLYVGPYGGLHRPVQASHAVAPALRPLRRITVFHPEVRYPRPAIPYDTLPDELLHHLQQTFAHDRRGPFPAELLDRLTWRACTACGVEHARPVCPRCAVAPPKLAQTIHVRGEVTSRRLARTRGVYVGVATGAGGELLTLAHEDGRFVREDGRVVTSGALEPGLEVRLDADATHLLQAGNVTTHRPGRVAERLLVEVAPGNVHAFGASGGTRTWAAAGRLVRDGALGEEHVGDVLAGQTRLWVGPRFGFGFYRAGGLSVTFLFDGKRRGLNDGVPLPTMRGELIDATCLFADDRAWFLFSAVDGGKLRHHAALVRAGGAVEAVAEADDGDGTWLGGGIRGRCAVGAMLLVPTDDGIVRVEMDAGALAVTRRWPDTAPFVDAGCALYVTRQGLAVVDHQEIRILEMK